MASSVQVILNQKACEGAAEYLNQCYQSFSQQYQFRQMLEMIDRQYMREIDWSKDEQLAKRANLWQYDPTKFRNVIVPVVLPQVESAVAYQTSVFLTGEPIFGVVAPPVYADAAMQMEALIGDQSRRGSWTGHFMKFFRDGFKYNLGALEVDWQQIKTPAFDITSDKNAAVRETVWEGNVIAHKNLYNTFFDSRYAPTEMHARGEFCGYSDLMSRIELKAYIDSLPAKQIQNIRKAFEAPVPGGGTGVSSPSYSLYYLPPLNSDALVDKDSYLRSTDWMAWAGLTGVAPKIQYRNYYIRTVLYARILPSELAINVPKPNTPQIWKFVYVNGSVLIYAERLTNAHNFLPMLFGQPLDDGLGYQTKSLAANAIPFQNIASALVNSNMAARRRAVSDRMFYDPSRIAPADINSDNPAAKIPVRPSAYGKTVSDGIYQAPFRDEQAATNVQEMQMTLQMADKVNGQNAARQGQFVKGNKTSFEFQDFMGNANARDQLVSINIESQTMTPLKEMLKINILQYQPQSTIIDTDKKTAVEVDPIALRKAVMAFKVSDGLIPSEKMLSGDELSVAFQTIQAVPGLQSGYNTAPMFSYIMKTRGVDLRPFEKSPEQIAYEQAVVAWQQTCIQMVTANKELDPTKLPPQPKPADFGWNPNPEQPPAA